MNDGRRLAIAMFVRSGSDRPGTIARAARAIFDGFNSLWRAPFTATAAAASASYSRQK